MKLTRFKAIYSIFVGVSIALLWIMLFSTGQIPELETEIFNISLHIISELLLAVALIVSGICVLLKRKKSEKLFLFSMGLLLYSIINAAGYYGQNSSWSMFVMFAILFLMTTIITISSFRN